MEHINEQPTHINLKLQTSEGCIVLAPRNMLEKFSNTVKDVILQLPESHECEVIPLPNISATILNKVIAYCSHHYNSHQSSATARKCTSEPIVPKIQPSSTFQYSGAHIVNGNTSSSIGSAESGISFCEWDLSFTRILDQATLFDLLLAANYLDIEQLPLLSMENMRHLDRADTNMVGHSRGHLHQYQLLADLRQMV
ncbi:E3 ubiquitin ligase complex SCF subunit sconC [Zancudomyces culisetae]|uniref:E3 ubiquitin ligase complex SCF subunit sconC n=1 Tax=Zancudomyces culisetae TaxID=1213189 RepID=A0A1R1PHK8_ZANCU|nr:E3 ubiquitin ligase complex SCF subunit sconC [Zancudomyces culisetae]|eukprot:OMH80428.1 E3 ubiquitin ligase complex SCF subunit sconC [Zancudomyces culisetae]